MQVIDCWEGAEDDSDGEDVELPLQHTGHRKEEQTPRSKAARIKHHQAERALRALISDILGGLRAEAAAAYERRVGRRTIEEKADQRMAEYMLGFRKGIAPDVNAVQSLPYDTGGGEIADGGIPGICVLNPQTAVGFEAFKSFLVPIISRNFEKGGYFKFLEALVLDLARDMKGAEVKSLGIGLVRLGDGMMSKEKVETIPA